MLSEQNVFTQYEIEEVKDFKDHVFYDGNKCSRKNVQKDLRHCRDNKRRYLTKIGDHVFYRYEIIKGLGSGAFGDVYHVLDHKYNKEKALKIIKAEPRFEKQARIEAHILNNLIKYKSKYIAKVENMFMFREHSCFVFELYSTNNIYMDLKANNFIGMDIKTVQKLAKQLLYGLKTIHDLSIIHCDLKPENLVFENDKSKENIKIIDFGSSCYVHDRIHNYIQSRYYRSPEIILSKSYDTKIDIWSFGAIIIELLLGNPIYPGKSEYEVIYYMIKTIGYPSNIEYLRSSRRFKEFFYEDDIQTSKSKENKDETLLLKIPIRRIDLKAKPLSEKLKFYPNEFINMINKCFQWDPALRSSAQELLEDDFFKLEL